MKNLFIKYGLNLTENQIDKFNKYYELLITYNQKFNITAITDKKEVYVKHFIDSALGAKLFLKGSLIDVGSGGGFPAIPIKILNEDLEITLLEATGKKCGFLETVILELGLKNIKVINGRAEDLAKNTDYRENFDYCTARAVARLNTLCEYCMPFVKVGGKFIAFKGDANDELKESLNAVKILGGKVNNFIEYDLDGAKRAFIEIEKIKNTEKKYPRGNGKERKNPL